ncbi:DUF2283 domain-containing protein [Nocardia sp. NPDC058666]|uniref:DUF2283 domain-containing protein n=1 Tax=Nocardia sp. NPDC058666 TaxID=3346587 RepID=UPI00365CEA60
MTTRPVGLHIDQNVGAAYIQINDKPVARTVEVTADVLVDLDALDMVVGVEILNLTSEIPIGQIERQFHIHSDAVALLQKIRPSVASFYTSFSTSAGSATNTTVSCEAVQPC